MTPTDDAVHAGQAIYTRTTLRSYDWLVLGVSNRWVWRCPTPRLVQLYNEHVTGNHLDVGVGTGYLLDHCRFPLAQPRIGLLDLNATCLAVAAQRIARFAPVQFQADVLSPLSIDAAPFDSIGLNYVLHCLPGTMDEKSRALDHLISLLRPGGVVFGSTLLSGGVRRGWAARKLMGYYNRQRIFSNHHDDFEQLEAALKQRFVTYKIDVVGCVALFNGRTASQ